ncbi:MAG: ribbon-helix-helix domain-containing protein [Candidatus Magasanikbacteria bacterium]
MRANINISIPEKMKEEVDQMVEDGGYASRSELIREALRNWDKYQFWSKDELKSKKTATSKEKLDDTDYTQW